LAFFLAVLRLREGIADDRVVGDMIMKPREINNIERG
jgi:hypothetical protein